jgi:hypothetical protein
MSPSTGKEGCMRIASVLTLATLALAPAALFAGDDPPQAKELLEGFQAQPGMFTIHRKEQDAFFEVPAGMLEKPFLLATSISGGPEYTGYQWWTTVCMWKRLGGKLLLVEREVRYRVKDPRKPMEEVVRKTYTDRLIHAAKIVALNGANPVLDLGALFGGQASKFFGRLGSRLDSSVVLLGESKSFPQNTNLVVTLPDNARDGRFTSLAYSFRQVPLPQMDPYRPRAADDRVGYFVTALKDFTEDTAKGDRFVRFVNRWKLEKADPGLERSPVKEPIIFYVEKTVPFRFRQAVAEGILAWNQAFEAVGLLNAVIVRQQTDTEFADLDPEDVRYNFFRWIVSGRAFAMGPSRVNPWTGQILDADIVFDESMVRHYLREYDLTIREAPKHFFSPDVRRRLERDPQRYWFAHAEGGQAQPSLEPRAPDFRACSLGEGLSHQLGLGALAAELAIGGNGEYPEAFITEVVRDVVMHEVGHTLGLRHNFKASTWRSMAEINAEEAPDDPCASVMDYNAVNVAPAGKPQGAYSMRTLGPYDRWAIQYGYGLFPSEEAGLAATVVAVASPQHAYGTDEDTWGPDPECVRWDLGRDPLEFASQRMDAAQRLLGKVLQRAVAKGESYRDARRAVDMLLYDYQNAALIAARFLGGQHVYRDHKGDPQERDALVPVAAERQRRALELVCQRVLGESSLKLDASLLRKLGKGNWSHWGSNDSRQPHSYPYHDRILGMQSWVLFSVLDSSVLERLIDTEAKAGPDADRVTIPEVFDRVGRAVFGDLYTGGGPEEGTDKQPALPTLRRNLQRQYVGELIQLLLEPEDGSTPAVVRDLAREEANRLIVALGAVAERTAGAWDAYSRSHLAALLEQLKKAREASFQIGGASRGGGAMIFSHGEDGDLRPLRLDDLRRERIDPRSPDALPWNR